MASPYMNIRQRIFIVITCLCLVLTSFLTISFTEDAAAPSPPKISVGDLIVTGGKTVLIDNYTSGYKQSGDIIIDQASTLIIRNSLFKMNPDTSHQQKVTVKQNSKLIIDNSIFTVDVNAIQATYLLRFDIYQSTMEIKDSSMIFPGTFNITQSTFKAINSKFEQLSVGYGSPIQIFNASYVYYEDCNVKDFKVTTPIKLLEDTKFVAINTFFDLDYDLKQMVVANSSQAHLYGITLNTGLYKNRPINVIHDQCWVNIYRWLKLDTVDKMNIPIGNTRISIKNQTDVYVQTPPTYILDYLEKTAGNYNYTNTSGQVIIPLMSDNLTRSSMPNSISTANYKITGIKGQYTAKRNFGLSTYPLLTKLSNTPNATITFNYVIPPKGNNYYTNTISDIIITDATGKIKNSIFQKPQGGVVDLSFGQQGNIVVNGTNIGGQLDLTGTKLGIEQDAENKYYILVEENGRLNFATKSGIMDGQVAPGVYPINVYMHDSAKMTLSGASVMNNVGSLGMDGDTELTMDNSVINGKRLFADGVGVGNSLTISAKNKAKLNFTAITIKNADVSLENVNVTSVSKPVFEAITMLAKNTSFNQKLNFKKGSEVMFYNVTDPWFFNISAEDTSIVDVFWYLTVVVKDEQGNRLKDAKVKIFNYTIENGQLVQSLYKSGLTNENGEFTYPVKGGFITSAGHYFGGIIGNYYVNASYFGTESDAGTGSSTRGATTRSRQSGGVDVFGENQELEIVIPGTPDVTVVSITQTPSPTEKNRDTTLKVVIQNIGNFTAFNVDVEIRDLDWSKTLKETTIPVLGPGNSTTIEVKYKYPVEGDFEIQVLVDPNEKIDELNENNNALYKIISIISKDRADLMIVNGSLITEPISPISKNSKVSVKATIKNVGTFDANNFFVEFYISNPANAALDFGQLGELIKVISLKPNGTIEVKSTVSWLATEIGTFAIKVTADSEMQIDEYNETNNSAEIEVITVIGPDLKVSEISFSPKPPITRESTFEITAVISNIGPSGTSNFFVGFYLNDLEHQLGSLIQVTSELNPNESVEVKFIVNDIMAKEMFRNAGEYRVYVYVDPENVISETDENNSAWKTLIIKKKADLAITMDDITFSELQAENGEDIDINAKITNIGETKSEGYTVRYYDVLKDRKVQIGNEIQLQGLEPNQVKTHKISWNSTIGKYHKIQVEILTPETDEESKENNKATKSIYIKTKPDLFVTADDITTNKDNEQALEDEEIQIRIVIHNGGNTSAGFFNVVIWDGAPDDPASIIIKEIGVSKLDANSEIQRSDTHTFKRAGLHHIYVVCDPTNRVDEFNELNNTGHRSIDITPTAPDLTIAEDDRDIKPIVTRNGQDMETSTLNNNDKYKFEIWISNLGNEIAREIEVEIYMDNTVTKLANYTLNNLSGELEVTPESDYRKSITVDVPKAAKYDPKSTGFHDIIILIDPENKIIESDEDLYSNEITVTKAFKIIRATLKVTRIEVLNSDGDYLYVEESATEISPKSNEPIKFVAYVDNLGTENASVAVEFYIDEVLVRLTSKKPIEAGEEGVAFNHEELYDGSKSVTVKCIAKGDFGETGDLPVDSEPREEYIIFYEKTDQEDTGGLADYLWLIIVIIVVVIVVVLIIVFLVMRKKREKMAECSECGALIPIDATECPKCGAEFSDEIECGECGALMKITDTTCPVCGAVFTKEGEEEEGEEGEEGAGLAGPVTGPPSVQDLKSKVKATPPKPPAPGARPKAVASVPSPAGPKPTPTPGPGPLPPPSAKPAPAPAVDEEEFEEEEAEEKAECYRCGAIVPLSASMCPECGAEFE